jgi:hypothetical protein
MCASMREWDVVWGGAGGEYSVGGVREAFHPGGSPGREVRPTH